MYKLRLQKHNKMKESDFIDQSKDGMPGIKILEKNFVNFFVKNKFRRKNQKSIF